MAQKKLIVFFFLLLFRGINMQNNKNTEDYGGVVKKEIDNDHLSNVITYEYGNGATAVFYVNRLANDYILKADANKYKTFIEDHQELIGKNVSFYDKGTCAGNYINNVVFHNDGIDLASFRPGFNNYVIRHFIIDENNNKFILDGVSVCDDTSKRNSTNIKQPTYFFKRPEDTEPSKKYDEYFTNNCFVAHENIYKNYDSDKKTMKKEDFNALKEQFLTISFDDYCLQRCDNDKDKVQNFKQSVLFDIEQVLNVCNSSVCPNTYNLLYQKYYNFINEQVDKFIKDNERKIWQYTLLNTPGVFFYPNGKINTTILSDKKIGEINNDIKQQLDKMIQYCEVDTNDLKKMKDSICNCLYGSFRKIIDTKWCLFVNEKKRTKTAPTF